MMINKIVLRNTAISILLITALMAVVIIRDRIPYGRNQSSFAVEPGREITRVDITGNENSISLIKTDGSWFAQGQFETRKSAVSLLLNILTGMRIKSPVSDSIFTRQITDRGVLPAKVQVYTGSKLIKTFLVYGTQSNTYGNIMKMSPGSMPFIVYVPGFEGDIGSVFTSSVLYWRPFTVFNLLPSEIASVGVTNHADTSSSFRIKGDDGKYFLQGMSGWDSLKVRRYISYFTYIPFESWVPLTAAGKIMTADTSMTIKVIKTTGEELILGMWEKVDSITGDRDSDRLYGKLSTMDGMFIIRYFDIDPLLKKRSYFYSE